MIPASLSASVANSKRNASKLNSFRVVLGIFAVTALGVASLTGKDSRSSGGEWKRKRSSSSNSTTISTEHHLHQFDGGKTEDPHTAIPSSVQEVFPACAIYFQNDVNIHVKEEGHFVSSTAPPRYDYLSCFAMKPRYNCAHSTSGTKKTTKEAADYKLVLRPRRHDNNNKTFSSNTGDCDVRAVIDHVGGPSGVARVLLLGEHQRSKTKKKTLKILMVGNSYVRQILESMACSWRFNITYNAFQVGGPAANSDNREFIETTMKPRLLGNMTTIHYQHKEACHGMQHEGDDLASYYRSDIGEIPTTIPECDDNIAVLEFDAVFRISYVFASFARNTQLMSHILRQVLLVEANETDYFVWNDNSAELVPASLLKRAQSRSIGMLLPDLRNKQKQELSRWFGADNPWITKAPDSHPCMPGVPDDEMNLLLFSILTNSNIF